MKIIYSGPSWLKLRLSHQEMESISICHDGRVDCENPETRSSLIAILGQARKETGFPLGRGKVMVEACHDSDGGMLTFTSPPEEKKRRGMAPVIFHFDDVSSLTDGISRLYGQYRCRIHKSSLYSWGEGFRLILFALDYADRLSVYFLSEYAVKLGEGEVLAAFVDEHGGLIVKDEAIETLAHYFSGE